MTESKRKHYQTGADSCACGNIWPCDQESRTLEGTGEPIVMSCDLDYGVWLLASIRGESRRSSRVIFMIRRLVNRATAYETTEITESEAQILLAMRSTP